MINSISNYFISYPLEKSDLKKAFKASWFVPGLRAKLRELPLEKLIPELLEDLGGIEGWLMPAVKCMRLEMADLKVRMSAESAIKEAALRSVVEIKGVAILKELATDTFYFIDHVLNLFINITGIREIGPGEQRFGWSFDMTDSWTAKARLEVYLALLLYPSVVCTFIYSQVGIISLSIALTALSILGFIVFCICYDRFLKPCPRDCAGLENLNTRIKQAIDNPLYVRRSVVQAVEAAFASGKGVLLVGNPGDGKSSFVLSYAEQIVSQKCCDLMKKTQLFSCNANAFVKADWKMDALSFNQLKFRFARQEKRAAFFFDEIASLFKSDGVKELLTFCDRFRYVFAATTTKEFEELIKNDESFMRRFEVVRINPLGEDEIEASLYQTLHYLNPELITEGGVIKHIAKKALEYKPGKATVDTAHALLSAAIVKATHVKFEALENEIGALSARKDLLQSKLLCHVTKECFHEFKKISSELQTKQSELNHKRGELKNVKKLEALYVKHKRQGYKLASSDRKEEWLENYTLVSYLEKAIEMHKVRLGLPGKLNCRLIDKIVEEYLK